MADLDDSEGPLVTGISPSVGLPGTKVTIRGENLGESKDDVIGTKTNFTKSYLLQAHVLYKVSDYELHLSFFSFQN